MKRTPIILTAALAAAIWLAGCQDRTLQETKAEGPKESADERAFQTDTKEVKSEKAGPGDDYYEYVNHSLLTKMEIPGDSNSWSYFYQLGQNADQALEKVLWDTVERRDQLEPGSAEQKIADLYLSAMDLEGRRKTGFGDLKPYLDSIQNASSVQEYLEAMARLNGELGSASLIPIVYYEDMADSDRYACYIYGASLGPGKETLEDPTQSGQLDQYRIYIQRMLVFAGAGDIQAAKAAGEVLDFQKDLAASALPLAEQSNPDRVYNPKSPDELQELYSNVDIQPFLEAAKAAGRESYVVADPGLSKKVNEYLTEENLPLLKNYSTVCLLTDFSDFLSPEIRDAAIEWNNAWKGILEKKTEQKMAGQLTRGIMGFEFGRLYVEKFFSEEDKRAIEDMAGQIMDRYKVRISRLDWMGEETKARAVKKLENMTLKIGYPREWPDYYDGGVVTPTEEGGNLIGNVISLLKARRAFEEKMVKQPVDRGMWSLTPQTVNAYYNPLNNEIVFPAAILQPPFYDPGAELAVNLGGIGTVIGHEISHAFDSSGALYDENGNYNLWWTKEDREKFEELANAAADYYDRQEGFEGRHVNGRQTLNENIADLGSLACLSSLVGDDKESLKLFFRQYAAIWASKYTDESMIQRLNTDVHSPGKVRVNAVLSSTDAFYTAYPEIGEGDPMYLAPEERVKIW